MLEELPTPAAAAAELHAALVETEGVDEFLHAIATLAATRVDADLSCGLTLVRDGRPMTVASSDALAARVDEVQYGNGVGPCLRALRLGEVVSIDDLATDDAWTSFRMYGLAHGVRSSFSVPLHVDNASAGALNLYAREPHRFGAVERERARQFADEAGRALSLALRMSQQVEMTKHLQAALASRATIDRAIGIVMGQNRCSADAAFDILRAASQHRNVKLRDVAAEIVDAVADTVSPPKRRFTSRQVP